MLIAKDMNVENAYQHMAAECSNNMTKSLCDKECSECQLKMDMNRLFDYMNSNILSVGGKKSWGNSKN